MVRKHPNFPAIITMFEIQVIMGRNLSPLKNPDPILKVLPRPVRADESPPREYHFGRKDFPKVYNIARITYFPPSMFSTIN